MDKEEFFTVLGSGSPDQVPAASVAEEDAEFEKKDERGVTLYKISDASGSLKVDTISQKPLRQDMLDTRDCFILDTGSGLYVWVGKGATQQEKTQSMAKAQGGYHDQGFRKELCFQFNFLFRVLENEEISSLD